MLVIAGSSTTELQLMNWGDGEREGQRGGGRETERESSENTRGASVQPCTRFISFYPVAGPPEWDPRHGYSRLCGPGVDTARGSIPTSPGLHRTLIDTRDLLGVIPVVQGTPPGSWSHMPRA